MKQIIFFLIFLFITSLISIPKVIAQAPTLSFGSNCGYADTSDASKCCETNLYVFDNNELKSKMPIGGSLVDILPKPDIKGIIPGYDQIVKKCYLGEPVGSGGSCICKQTATPSQVKQLEEICKKFTNGDEKSHCINCAAGGGILTGIGCVPLNLSNFISDYLLKIFIGFAGIIAFLCIIYSAFTLQTSRGNPEKIKKAQELLTSCIMGLMLIIFSVFILKLVGVDILKIPGLD